MSLASIMGEIAGAVREHPRLTRTTFEYPEKKPGVPAFVVTLPEDWDPNYTYGRHVSEIVLNGWLVLSINDMKTATKDACEFYDYADPKNLIALIQDHRYQSCSKVVVQRVRFEPVILGDVVYVGARNTLRVIAPGR